MVDDTRWSKDFREAFLKANANADYISSEFADVLRNLMRALVSSGSSNGIYRAAQHMDFVAELLNRTEEEISFHDLFARALDRMREDPPTTHPVTEAIVHAAESGVKFLVERSCDDGAARGRASRREDEFLSAIRRIDGAREYARQQPGKPRR